MFRRLLSQVCTENEEYKEAVQTLKEIVYDDDEFSEERLDDDLSLADLYYEQQNPVMAEQHVYKTLRWIPMT